MIRHGEKSQARIHSIPGNVQRGICGVGSFDDNYIMVGAHVDESLQEKIKRGEYIDFGKLLPKDKGNSKETKLSLVYKGGQMYFVPSNERDSANVVNSFYRWEQAFRVYSNVYLGENPGCATELVEYNHVICTTASTYQWENVYAYDREFRIHMSKYPMRNWGLILQQAWTMLLKDRIRVSENKFNQTGKKKKEICQNFNKGLCSLGLTCNYEHRCLECNKFGHGAHICRKRKNNGTKTSANGHRASGATSGAQSTTR